MKQGTRAWLCTVLAIAAASCAADSTGGRGGGSLSGGAGTAAADGGVLGSGSSGALAAGGSSGGNTGGTGGASGGTLPAMLIDQCGNDNPAQLSASDVSALQSASGSATGMAYLYPYDGTVFPRGLIPPTLMWSGADGATAVYVHLKSASFEYKGCVKPTGKGQLLLATDVWTAAEAHAGGPSDPVSIDLSVLDGSAKGALHEQVIIAQATLKGSIYYNSYASKLAMNGGSVLRIVPGKDVELFVGGGSDGCKACHALSADGTRLITQTGNQSNGEVFSITPTTAVNPAASSNAVLSNFVGLSPDGKVYLINSSSGSVHLRSSGGSSAQSLLYETDTAKEVMNTGIPTTAIMPTFSPSGKLLVFNDSASGAGHGLSIMDYDAATRTAKNHRDLVMISDKLPGWPFVLPDDKAVVFAIGTESDFAGGNVGINAIPGFVSMWLGGLGGWSQGQKGPYSNLFLVSAQGGTPILLAKAMGYATETDAMAKKPYPPLTDVDVDQNYYPTVSPVAAGGYFWVFFDSMRNYGNKGVQRQLWGTALTISPDGTYATDPSHPPFFLTGQEEGTGNHRAFTALDPCKGEGEACSTGIDCCGGFCENDQCNKPPTPRCAKTDEACEQQSDCCNQTDSCINGFCGLLIPQ